MSRPVSIDEEKVLQVARRVFLRYGYRVTTRFIANTAGVSEGSLFKHFKTKSSLFLAAMDSDSRVDLWEDGLMKIAGAGGMRKILQSAGLRCLRRMQSLLPCMIMVRTSGIALCGPHREGGSNVPSPVTGIKALTSCFRTEIRRRRLVMADPEVKAQILMGALMNYELLKLLFNYSVTSPDKYVRTVVDTLIGDDAPEEGKEMRRRRRCGHRMAMA